MDLRGVQQQGAPAVLADPRREIEQAPEEGLAASALRRAVAYALVQWPKFVRVGNYPELELSNNLAENAIRLVALGRRNRLDAGRAEGSPKIGAILSSVAETCRRLRIELRAYLLDVVPSLADTGIEEMPNSRRPWGLPSAAGGNTNREACESCDWSSAYTRGAGKLEWRGGFFAR